MISGAGAGASEKNEIELVSRASGPLGAGADDDSNAPSVSAEGRFVAFATRARNVVPEDTDDLIDVYVRDRSTDTTTLVSRASGEAGPKGNGHSPVASISADGRFVAFSSSANNLTPEGAAEGQIYLRDLQANTTTLVSRGSGAFGTPSNRLSFKPALSADGSVVAFSSSATNLDPDVTNGKINVFIRDFTRNATELVSRDSGENGEVAGGTNPSISANGSQIVFQSLDDPLYAVYVRDRKTDKTTVIDRNDSGSPAISADGRRVAFELFGDVWVYRLKTGSKTLVSDEIKGPRNARLAIEPTISENGNLIAFTALFRERGDRKPRARLYVANLRKDKVSPVPGAVTGRGFDDLEPSISGNGRWVAFQSTASGLATDDSDTEQDIFVTKLGR